MHAWWDGLSDLNRLFFGMATFFSIFFIWQIIAALFGLIEEGSAGDSDLGGAEMEGDPYSGDPSETMMAFKLINFRSIVTFFTLFSWGGALYLSTGHTVSQSMGLATLWGLAGMISVAALIYLLLKLTHTGTQNLDTAIGVSGDTYLDIPANGTGEIRIKVSGIFTHVKARSAEGQAIRAGSPVIVTRRLSSNVLEVNTIPKQQHAGED